MHIYFNLTSRAVVKLKCQVSFKVRMQSCWYSEKILDDVFKWKLFPLSVQALVLVGRNQRMHLVSESAVSYNHRYSGRKIRKIWHIWNVPTFCNKINIFIRLKTCSEVLAACENSNGWKMCMYVSVVLYGFCFDFGVVAY